MAEKIRYKDVKEGDRLTFEWIDSQDPGENDTWTDLSDFEGLAERAEATTTATIFRVLRKGLLIYRDRSHTNKQFAGCRFVPSVSIRKNSIERLS